MTGTIDVAEIEAKALALPLDARASLARRLLQSLEEVSEAEYERLWGDESARRASSFNSGPRACALGYESRPDPEHCASGFGAKNPSGGRPKPTQGELGLHLERRSPTRPGLCSGELQLPP